MRVIAIAVLMIILGCLIGLNGFPLFGFVTVTLGGLLPFVYEPLKSLWK